MFTSSIRERMAKSGYKSVSEAEILVLAGRLIRLSGVSNDPMTIHDILRILREELNNDYNARGMAEGTSQGNDNRGTDNANGARRSGRGTTDVLPSL